MGVEEQHSPAAHEATPQHRHRACQRQRPVVLTVRSTHNQRIGGSYTQPCSVRTVGVHTRSDWTQVQWSHAVS
eukprot:m.356597 g.356597  ORF g.356597 m.356597 type:complete len:73 (+) comp20755_c0_seq1:2853-3071(+)